MLGDTREVFQIPISFEWSFVNEGRTEIRQEGKSAFHIQEGEKLSDVLHRVCAIENGKLQWLRMHGSLVILPIAGSETIESTLDIVVSFEVQNVPTWEALCVLARTVNESRATDRTLKIVPGFADGYQGPPEFSETKSISLSLAGVTAREVLLAIIETSPVYMRYDYQNVFRPKEGKNVQPLSQVTVYPAVSGKDPKSYPFMDRREYLQTWLKEIDSQIPEIDSAAISDK